MDNSTPGYANRPRDLDRSIIPFREDYPDQKEFYRAVRLSLVAAVNEITDVLIAVHGLKTIGSTFAGTISEYGMKDYSEDDLEGIGNAVLALSQSAFLKMNRINVIVDSATWSLGETKEVRDEN